jgi:hypothetical protein
MEHLPISSEFSSSEYPSHIVKDALEIFGDIEGDYGSDCQEEPGAVRGMPWAKWLHFCQQVETKSAQPTCIVDFPYADKKGKLKLQGDDRLLMRMYCFSDTQKGDNIRIAVHVHTSLRWGQRSSLSLPKRIQRLTSVNVRYARRVSKTQSKKEFEQDAVGRIVVPFSREMQARWSEMNHIEWEWEDADSIPMEEYEPASASYSLVRRVIAAGESLLTDEKAQAYFETTSKQGTQTVMRHGKTQEYEVVAVSAHDPFPRAAVGGTTTGSAYPSKFPCAGPVIPRILFAGINVAGQEEIQVSLMACSVQFRGVLIVCCLCCERVYGCVYV